MVELGRSYKAKQNYVGFTCRNFSPCGVHLEKVREGIKNGGRQRKNLLVTKSCSN